MESRMATTHQFTQTQQMQNGKSKEINLGKKFDINKSTATSNKSSERPKKRTFRTNATSMPISTKIICNVIWQLYEKSQIQPKYISIVRSIVVSVVPLAEY